MTGNLRSVSGALLRLDPSPRAAARRGVAALVIAALVELAIVAVARAADWPPGAFYTVSALALAILVAVLVPIIEPPTRAPRAERATARIAEPTAEGTTEQTVQRVPDLMKDLEASLAAVRGVQSPGSEARPADRAGETLGRVGESLVGEGNEVAHTEVLIGRKDGPVGRAFATALVNQKEGHTNLLAVVAPNLPAKPDTIISNKVTIKGATQAVQMFGPAQAAVARAVVDSVREGVISEGDVDDLCLIVGVFIHWEATDDKKIFDFNYRATKEAIARALSNEASASAVVDSAAAARYPFSTLDREI